MDQRTSYVSRLLQRTIENFRVVTSDDWLKTGDVIQVKPFSNAFKVIDRVKNNFKMQTGLYVSLSKVE